MTNEELAEYAVRIEGLPPDTKMALFSLAAFSQMCDEELCPGCSAMVRAQLEDATVQAGV
jgi:hypothetical protein